MTEQELIQGYETEIHYQKHMIENIGRWFSLFFTLPVSVLSWSISFIEPICFFHRRSHLGYLGILAMLVFGYGIYKGRLNLQKVIDDLKRSWG